MDQNDLSSPTLFVELQPVHFACRLYSPFFHNKFHISNLLGAIASVITLPADVVKTRQQMMIDSYREALISPNPSNSNSHSIKSTIVSLYTSEGIRGFYRGKRIFGLLVESCSE